MAPPANRGRAVWIAALAIIGIVVAFFAMGRDDSPRVVASKPSKPSAPPPKVAAPPSPADVSTQAPAAPTARPRTPRSPATNAAVTEPAGDSDGGSAGTDDSSDPRTPPSGTSEEAAAVFTKLPVSAADRPPIGGVGLTGIHIDRITMGTRYSGSRCEGETERFSAGQVDLASVCVRVVHQRLKEELAVLWHKKGGTTRRSKLIVKPAHAYRTRAYLKLRREYVGDWTVSIVSSDGTELASHDFTVVE